MPNGTDPHDWKPAPKDVEAMNDALVVVSNGLDLEEGLEDTLEQVRAAGVPTFEAADHVAIRRLGDDGVGAEDPHVWMSAENMAAVAAALATELAALGLDVEDSGAAAVTALEALDAEVEQVLDAVPPERRLLVSGHESLGYFADRYRFELVGAVVPGLSSQAEVSARDLAELAEVLEATGVPAIFTELGTPASVVEEIAADTGVAVVELPTHTLPPDGTYRSFLLANARAVASALR
jgi:zinc/manganese transport system substrate-binding protein